MLSFFTGGRLLTKAKGSCGKPASRLSKWQSSLSHIADAIPFFSWDVSFISINGLRWAEEVFAGFFIFTFLLYILVSDTCLIINISYHNVFSMTKTVIPY